MSKAKLDVEEYNRAVDAIAATVSQLGVGAQPAEEEDGFPVICKLNVGGTEFQCHRDHLRSQPGSLLSECYKRKGQGPRKSIKSIQDLRRARVVSFWAAPLAPNSVVPPFEARGDTRGGTAADALVWHC
jgi:hypothetical protein